MRSHLDVAYRQGALAHARRASHTAALGLARGCPRCTERRASIVGACRAAPQGVTAPALQPEGPDQVVDVRAREVEAPRGLDHVPALRFKGVVQEADLEAAGRLLEGGRRLRLERAGGLR